MDANTLMTGGNENMMNKCHCGCGQDVPSTGTGRPGKFYNGTCRVRYHRQQKSVTEVNEDSIEVVTKDESNVTQIGPVDIVTKRNESGLVKPVLKYPGSKTLAAQWIVSNLPAHKIYVEPFFGSGAVFFNKPAADYEVINDLDSQVVNLFKVIRDQSEALCDLIEMTPYAREEYYAALNHVPTGDALEDARQFLARCWMAHGAKTSDRTGWMNRGAKAGSSTTSRWNKLPDRIRCVVSRLKDPEIENAPALELLNRFKDASNCLIYCDPPYVLETRNKRRMYKHEMTDQDHIDLLNALDAHAGPVVLSGYAHPLYDDRLKHWQRLTAPALAEKGKMRTEVLWLNAKAKRQQLSLFDEEAM